MKKKLLAVVTALTVMAMGTVTAFAASPTAGTTEAPVSTQKATTAVAATATPAEYAQATAVSDGFTVTAVEKTTVDAAAVQVQNSLLNDLATIGTKLGNSDIAAAATDSNKKVTASILSVVNIDASTAAKGADGKYQVTASISGIKSGDSIAILHYTGSAWETIVPDSVAAGSVTFKTSSFSPFAVVKLEVASVTASPKTGATMPMAVLVIMVGFAGTMVCGKKYFA